MRKFIEKFQLTDDDVNVINRYLKDERFQIKELFEVIEKIQKIRHDCQILMKSGHQKIAINVIEQMDEYHVSSSKLEVKSFDS